MTYNIHYIDEGGSKEIIELNENESDALEFAIKTYRDKHSCDNMSDEQVVNLLLTECIKEAYRKIHEE
jgi:hypothetical protein